MYVFPGRDELLGTTASGAISILDSVLGAGYAITLQMGVGVRFGDGSDLLELADEPPFFPVRCTIEHYGGQEPAVKLSIFVRGRALTLRDLSVLQGIPIPRETRHLATGTIFTGYPHDGEPLQAQGENFALAIIEAAQLSDRQGFAHLDGPEAKAGDDVVALTRAVRTLQMRADTANTVLEMAKKKLQDLVLAEFENGGE